jgi:hypothetical protein
MPTDRNPTYRDLMEFFNKIPKERLDDNITIFNCLEGEFAPIKRIKVAKETDVLDKGHVFLVCVNQ